MQQMEARFGGLFLRGGGRGKKDDGHNEEGKALWQGMSPEAEGKSEYRARAEPGTSLGICVNARAGADRFYCEPSGARNTDTPPVSGVASQMVRSG